MKTRKAKQQQSPSPAIRFADLVPRREVSGGRTDTVLFGTLAWPPRQQRSDNPNATES